MNIYLKGLHNMATLMKVLRNNVGNNKDCIRILLKKKITLKFNGLILF